MVYPHKWSPISCRSSAGQRKIAAQRPTSYHCATQPTNSGEIVCINTKRVCGFTVSHLSYALLRRIVYTYLHAAYCYPPSSVVCRSICRSVSLSYEACKNAVAIEMPFKLRTWVGQMNHVLHGCPLQIWQILSGGEGRTIVKYRDTLWPSVQKTAEPIPLPFSCGLEYGPMDAQV